jgi:hypothetical protein
MSWRPLVHVEDSAAAYLAVLEAPRERVHDQAFNVGATDENYRVMQVAKLVEEVVPGARITFAGGASPNKRNYRVNCDKLMQLLPGYRPRWALQLGIEQVYTAYRDEGLTEEEFLGPRYLRLRHLKDLMQEGSSIRSCVGRGCVERHRRRASPPHERPRARAEADRAMPVVRFAMLHRPTATR